MRRIKYTSQRAKSLLKIAAKNIPQSLSSLKKSLSLSRSNLLSFASSLQQCEEIKNKNSLQNRKKSSLINKGNEESLVNSKRGLIIEHKEGTLLRKQLRTRKRIKEQMKIGKSTLQLKNQIKEKSSIIDSHFIKLQHQRQKKQAKAKYQFVAPKHQNKSIFVFQSKKNRPATCRFSLKTQQTDKIDVSQRIPIRGTRSLLNTQQFWMRRGNSSQNQNNKLNTEYFPQSAGNRTLSELTDYSPKKYNKTMNLLILQLELNLTCDKHKRLKTAS